MPDDRLQAALDALANSIAVAVLLAARLEADRAELRRAIDAAAAALNTLKPKEHTHEG